MLIFYSYISGHKARAHESRGGGNTLKDPEEQINLISREQHNYHGT